MDSLVNEDIAYLRDIEEKGPVPADAAGDNIAVFGAKGSRSLVDSGKKLSDYALESEMGEVSGDVRDLSASVGGLASSVVDACALAAYDSSEWNTATIYHKDDFCKYGNNGYICIVNDATPGVFKPEEWKLVLASKGYAASYRFRSGCRDGLAKMEDLAPDIGSGGVYSEGDLVVNDGKLQICTTGGYASGYDAATFEDTTLNDAIQWQLYEVAKALDDFMYPGSSSSPGQEES